MINLKNSWEFWALSAGVFAALTAIFIKAGIENINSDYATFIRTLVVLPLLVAFLIYTDQWKIPVTWSFRNWLYLALSAIATTIAWISYFRALKIGAASQVVPVKNISIVLVAFLGVIFFNEDLSFLNWIGITLVVVGAFYIGR